MHSSLFQDIVPESCMRSQAPMREYTTMRVGGPADLLIAPQTEEQCVAILQRANENGIPVYVMGNGSNLLFADSGYRGVVLQIGKTFARISVEQNKLTAQAGALLSTLSRTAAEHSLIGLEFASGIPGSVGGAVCMNAGAYGGEIAQVIDEARVYVQGRLETWDRDRLSLSYRHSAVMEEGALVLSARFTLTPGDKNAIEAKMQELNARRREKQPLQYPSCGSFFKRPEGHFAGALIEQAGLKGYAVGDAQVSELHAGFLINRGHATAGQFYTLMKHVQTTVLDRFGVQLEPEVRLIGDFEA